MNLPPDFILHLSRLLEGQSAEEGLGDIRSEDLPALLSGHAVDYALAPSRRGPGERAKLRRLGVLEPSGHESRVDDSFAADLLPFEDPAGVNHIVGDGLRHPLEGFQIVPALQLLQHGLIHCGLMLASLVDREDVVGPLDDRPLESRGVELKDVMLTLTQRWQVRRLIGDQQEAHGPRELHRYHGKR